jgi:hypothetical protein
MQLENFSFGSLVDGKTYAKDVVIDRGKIRERCAVTPAGKPSHSGLQDLNQLPTSQSAHHSHHLL